jgi:hypothetical protein
VVGRQKNKGTDKQRAITFSRVAEKSPKKKPLSLAMMEAFFGYSVPVAQLPLNFKKGKYATSIHAF